MKAATSSPERQLEDVVVAAESVGGHIIGRADDWEVSGATDPMKRPQLGPWLRDERGPYDGLVAAAVDRLGRNVVDCLNTGYKMRDDGKLLVTHGHEGPWDLDDPTDENRFTMEAWGAQTELRRKDILMDFHIRVTLYPSCAAVRWVPGVMHGPERKQSKWYLR
ncbi:recombinase family protein [Streptomyces carpaticus]|uniref:Recombinase family protein n=1 Tax=Streptomyces carpaticus TaxID=285558 RepID=A0ABV4ZIL0_9ACTN